MCVIVRMPLRLTVKHAKRRSKLYVFFPTACRPCRPTRNAFIREGNNTQKPSDRGEVQLTTYTHIHTWYISITNSQMTGFRVHVCGPSSLCRVYPDLYSSVRTIQCFHVRSPSHNAKILGRSTYNTYHRVIVSIEFLQTCLCARSSVFACASWPSKILRKKNYSLTEIMAYVAVCGTLAEGFLSSAAFHFKCYILCMVRSARYDTLRARLLLLLLVAVAAHIRVGFYKRTLVRPFTHNINYYKFAKRASDTCKIKTPTREYEGVAHARAQRTKPPNSLGVCLECLFACLCVELAHTTTKNTGIQPLLYLYTKAQQHHQPGSTYINDLIAHMLKRRQQPINNLTRPSRRALPLFAYKQKRAPVHTTTSHHFGYIRANSRIEPKNGNNIINGQGSTLVV